jgi:hypothetical protein
MTHFHALRRSASNVIRSGMWLISARNVISYNAIGVVRMVIRRLGALRYGEGITTKCSYSI